MEITIPHLFQPRPYQLPFLRAWDSGQKRFVLVWHRRSGKDLTAISNLPKRMFERKGAYYYFAPTYSQGKKIIWDGMDGQGVAMLERLPKELRKGKPNETEMKIELQNGSFFQIIGTDKIDSVVGTNPVGCIFTEYSLQDPRAWDLVRPILAENGGWAVFIFTPRGMNHGHKILQQAREEGWFNQILTVDDTKAIPQEVLDAEKRQMPQDLYEQEYYCKFIEGAGQFFKRILENRYIPDNTPIPTHKYKMGVDLAKYQDYTVLTTIDLNTFKVHKQERFNQLDYNLQKAKIEAHYLRYYKPLITIDSTGVGEPIYDDLCQKQLRVEPYQFTERSRMDLLQNLQLLLEQDKIKIPDDEQLIAELQSFQYTLTASHKIKVQVPEGMHDDMVMSLALAVWNLPQNPLSLPGSLKYLTSTQPVEQTRYD